MSQRRKVPEGQLCDVCSDKATGYHYGVASCNGCKTFFRRTVVSDLKFTCQFNGNCDIDKNVRCACRHCRFEKCLAAGMDANAIQNDRDRISSSVKVKREATPSNTNNMSYSALIGPYNIKREHSFENCNPDSSLVENTLDVELMNKLEHIESLCNDLRKKVINDELTAREILPRPSLLYEVAKLADDVGTQFREFYPASMNDVQMWNIRELRLCLEWVKVFPEFRELSSDDQFALVHNFAFTFNILNRVFYSIGNCEDKIVYHNGAYILRQPQDEVRIPGCRSIYHRQMDEIMIPLRKLKVDKKEFAAFKFILLFNPDATELSHFAKPLVETTREKYVKTLFHYMIHKNGINEGGSRYGKLLLMTSSIQQIIAQNEENMQVMEVFGHFWRINQFVKELCMKARENDKQ
uniref:Nuclear receptor domain-containing protein n=1 Tax=Parastrongyloides trichosuri TaxID=131310 RepID=A0A0N4ZNU5_PARTI